MKPEIIKWVTDALMRVRSTVKQVPESQARRIVSITKNTFVLGNPRVWWLALKGVVTVRDSQTLHLTEVLPSHEAGYWFIPETETEDLAVFDLSLYEMETVLSECPFFEYYVVSKENNWLVAESDHNRFYVALLKL